MVLISPGGLKDLTPFRSYYNIKVEANSFLGQKAGPPIGLEAHTMGIKAPLEKPGYGLITQAFLPISDFLLGSVNTILCYIMALC